MALDEIRKGVGGGGAGLVIGCVCKGKLDIRIPELAVFVLYDATEVTVNYLEVKGKGVRL